MKTLDIIGEKDESIEYVERPTVKVIIVKDGRILIINDGLLPGGGIEDGESNDDAIARELQEELGVTVTNIKDIGRVHQYRNFLGRLYEVYGYMADFVDFNATPNPQDAREAAFVHRWMTAEEAITYISESIEKHKMNELHLEGDALQGKLYNLMTTLSLVREL